jgi:DUF4097 and DUF4098 domain-containing protein YvlB
MKLPKRPSGSAGGPSVSVLAMIGVVLFAIPALFFAWWGASKLFDSTTKSHYEATSPVERVVLDTGDVNVEIREAAVDTVTVDTNGTYFLDEPDVDEVIEDGALKIKADCGSIWTTFNCDTDLTVLVPKGVSVSLDGGQGDVRLVGLTGKLAVKSGSGDVIGSGLLGGDVLAVSGTGDVDLDLASAPTRLDVSTDTGDIDVIVPNGGYAVDLKSETGDSTLSGVRNDSSSDRTIRGVSDAGDIAISGRQAA